MPRLLVPSFLVAASRLATAAPPLAPAPAPAQADANPTSVEKLWIPPRGTGAVDNLYASVVTAAPDATEYLLACTPDFETPYPASCNDFTGVTLTQGPSTMRVEIGADAYQCDLASDEDGNESAICDIRSGAHPHAASTVDGPEAEAWLSAVTVVPGEDDAGDRARLDLKLRKRQAGGEGDDDDDQDTSASSSGTSTSTASSASASESETGDSRCPSRNNDDDDDDDDGGDGVQDRGDDTSNSSNNGRRKRSPQKGSGSSAGVGNIGNRNCNQNDDSAAGSVRASLLATAGALGGVVAFVAFAL